jgi:hypothetical protein
MSLTRGIKVGDHVTFHFDGPQIGHVNNIYIDEDYHFEYTIRAYSGEPAGYEIVDNAPVRVVLSFVGPVVVGPRRSWLR